MGAHTSIRTNEMDGLGFGLVATAGFAATAGLLLFGAVSDVAADATDNDGVCDGLYDVCEGSLGGSRAGTVAAAGGSCGAARVGGWAVCAGSAGACRDGPSHTTCGSCLTGFEPLSCSGARIKSSGCRAYVTTAVQPLLYIQREGVAAGLKGQRLLWG
jgi:hypothetical protein